MNSDYSLYSRFEDSDYTIYDKMKEFAGSIVNEYINSLNIEEFKLKKEKFLAEQKSLVLNNAEVLLISDNEDDYRGLVDYGFKKIDYFKSIIRADRYFENRFDELNKYKIIILGSKSVNCCLEGHIDLEQHIHYLLSNRDILITHIYRSESDKNIGVSLHDNNNWHDYTIEDKDYNVVLDGIVENASFNKVLEVRNNILEYSPIKDYINPIKLPFAKKKEDLKILYLEAYSVSDYTKEIADNLGLNVTFKEDNNAGLGRNVIRSLGEFDIIITSNSFSSRILQMNNESTEQCKDTGRKLTLLVTYDCDGVWYSDEDKNYSHKGIGDEVNLKYIFGGELAPSSEINSIQYRTLRTKSYNSDTADDWHETYIKSGKIDMQSILEQSVNIYNEAVMSLGNPGISNLEFKTAAMYDKEYQVADDEEQERKKKVLEPINLINDIIFRIKEYLRYKMKGYIKGKLEGLRITENSTGICVENILEGRTLCAIMFAKDYKEENLRVFSVQTVNKKGRLGDYEVVGVYTRKFEQLDGIPKRPNERQMNAIMSTSKKINKSLVPLIDDARHRCYAQEAQMKRVLKNTKKEGF